MTLARIAMTIKATTKLPAEAGIGATLTMLTINQRSSCDSQLVIAHAVEAAEVEGIRVKDHAIADLAYSRA